MYFNLIPSYEFTFFNVHDGLKKIYFLLFGVIMDILHGYLDISFFIKMLHILKKEKVI